MRACRHARSQRQPEPGHLPPHFIPTPLLRWGKHGTCSIPLFPNATAFFAAAVGLNDAYSLEAALANYGVDVQTAAQTGQGVSPSDVVQAS